MDKMLNADPQSDTRKAQKIDYKAEIAKMFDELKKLDEQTRRSQAETERLRGETRQILARLKAA